MVAAQSFRFSPATTIRKASCYYFDARCKRWCHLWRIQSSNRAYCRVCSTTILRRLYAPSVHFNQSQPRVTSWKASRSRSIFGLLSGQRYTFTVGKLRLFHFTPSTFTSSGAGPWVRAAELSSILQWNHRINRSSLSLPVLSVLSSTKGFLMSAVPDSYWYTLWPISIRLTNWRSRPQAETATVRYSFYSVCSDMVSNQALRLLLIGWTVLSCCSTARVSQLRKGRASSLSKEKVIDRDDDPFEQFAQFLIRSSKKSGELGSYSSDEVRRTVKKLAAGQEALKSMDGAAHQLRSTFSDRCVEGVS